MKKWPNPIIFDHHQHHQMLLPFPRFIQLYPFSLLLPPQSLSLFFIDSGFPSKDLLLLPSWREQQNSEIPRPAARDTAMISSFNTGQAGRQANNTYSCLNQSSFRRPSQSQKVFKRLATHDQQQQQSDKYHVTDKEDRGREINIWTQCLEKH